MQHRFISNLLYFILLKYTKSQYNPNVYNGLQQGYQYSYQNLPYPQYSNQRSYKDYENSKWALQERKNYEEYDYTEENPCPCDKCEELTPSCKVMCPNCQSTPSPVIAPNYVFLPFPYPYPMSPNTFQALDISTTNTTTESTVNIVITEAITTTKAITEATTKAVPKSLIISTPLPDDNNDGITEKSPFNVKDKGQYMLTSLRRTKPNWLPKYGIVPIPDKFAEKLMLQLRSMKVLHPQKDNIRNIDNITPL